MQKQLEHDLLSKKKSLNKIWNQNEVGLITWELPNWGPAQNPRWRSKWFAPKRWRKFKRTHQGLKPKGLVSESLALLLIQLR